MGKTSFFRAKNLSVNTWRSGPDIVCSLICDSIFLIMNKFSVHQFFWVQKKSWRIVILFTFLKITRFWKYCLRFSQLFVLHHMAAASNSISSETSRILGSNVICLHFTSELPIRVKFWVRVTVYRLDSKTLAWINIVKP